MNIKFKKGIVFSLAVTASLLMFAHPSMAQTLQTAATSFVLNNVDVAGLVTDVLANIVNQVLQIAGLILALSGTLLNFSINLTLHIKEFVSQSEAVYDVWRIIRDISGMFIIFGLLYSAISLITGLGKPGFGNLIKNIVVAGILINFSFFAVSVAIDASNIVSLQIYNAIAPANTLNPQNLNPQGIVNTFKDGGISDIFMKSLSITKLYSPGGQSNNESTSWASPLRVMLLGVISTMIILTAALSFFFAAIAFVLRFIILIFLLAFSPIWFASWVIPWVKDEVGAWTNYFKSQLLFMPAYLLLMYFAIRLMTSSEFFRTSEVQGGPWYVNLMVVAVNAIIVIFMLNLPLFVAHRLGGKATSWININKFGAKGLWGGVASKSYQQSVGRAASRISRNTNFQTWAGNSSIGEKLLKSTRSFASGYDQSLDKRIREREQFAQSLNRGGATGYADRMSTSIPARLSVFHSIGRADRVAAAGILNTRMTEITTDLNRLTGELNQINNAANQPGPGGAPIGLPGLPRWQQERYDRLTGGNSTGSNPGGVNEIQDAQNDMNNIRTQLNTFQARMGESARNIQRRRY